MKWRTEDYARCRPPVAPDGPAADNQLPQPTPRPPGAYPRAIEHQERVEYQYDPETDDFDAKVIESSEPVVTQWDMSAPERDARPVGTWEVTPREDGVDVENVERADVPEDVQERLRQESAETGGPVSTTATVRFQHDLNTRETSTRSPGRSPAALAEALQARRAPGGVKLNDRYQQILEGMMKQREQAKSARARRRTSSGHDKIKDGPAELPQIVVIQDASDPSRRRRIG